MQRLKGVFEYIVRYFRNTVIINGRPRAGGIYIGQLVIAYSDGFGTVGALRLKRVPYRDALCCLRGKNKVAQSLYFADLLVAVKQVVHIVIAFGP